MSVISGHLVQQAEYRLSVILVNYNGRHVLPRCMQALSNSVGRLNTEIIVVDNASTDGSADLPCCDGENLTVIRLDANVGFGRANNIGIEAARGRYFLLLNTDCFVQPGLPQILASRLDADERCAVVGPRLLNANGTLQPSAHNFPTPLIFLLEQSGLWKVLRHVPGVANRLLLASPHQRAMQADWLAGACLMVRPKAIRQVRGFDEAFFFYWEEADLCMRLRKRGYTVMLEPEARATHLGGGSSADPTLLVMFFKSLFLFYAKHFIRSQLRAVTVMVRAMAYFKAARTHLQSLRARGTGGSGSETRQSRDAWLSVAKLQP